MTVELALSHSLKDWHQAGFHPHTVCPPGVGSASISDKNKGKAPGRLATGSTTEWEGMKWAGLGPDAHAGMQRSMDAGANVGVRCGEGHVFIDCDLRDKTLSEALLVHAENRFGKSPLRVGRAPKWAMLLRVAGPAPATRMLSVSKAGDPGVGGIEILSTGRQIVVQGIHPGTMAPYRWEYDPCHPDTVIVSTTREKVEAFVASLPEWAADQGLVIKAPAASSPATPGADAPERWPGTLDDFVAMVAEVPNPPETTRAAWLAMGHAIKGALPDEPVGALEAWCDWSEKWDAPLGSEPNTREGCAAEWATLGRAGAIRASWRDIAGRSSHPAGATAVFDAEPISQATIDGLSHAAPPAPKFADQEAFTAAIKAEAKAGRAVGAFTVAAIASGRAPQGEAEVDDALRLAVDLDAQGQPRADRRRREVALKRDLKAARQHIQAARLAASRHGAREPGTPPPGFTIEGEHLLSGAEDQPKTHVSDAILALAMVADASGLGHSLLLQWTSGDGAKRGWLMPMAMLAADHGALFAALLDRGFIVQSDQKARALFLRFLTLSAAPLRKQLRRLVRKTGKVPGLRAFAMAGGQIIGPDAEGVVLSPDAAGAVPRMKGSLDGWRANIAAMAKGNPLIGLAVSVGFASALFDVLGADGAVVHVSGASTTGKTTLLRLMASVAGIDTPTWRATDNGLEGRFAASSGIGAALDEIGQCEPEVVANIAYMVAQGAGKQRAARDGSARGVREWCVVVFSTGEKTLAQVLSGRRVAVQAGQGVRFLDVPVTGIGAAHGAFGNLHGEADGAAFARRLGRAAERQSGHALAAFIEWVMGQEELPEIIAGRAVARVEAELQARTPKGTQPQAMRALATFARIAAAGELATQAGVTGWPSGLATDAAYRAWQAWLTSRDAGSADSEGMAAVRRVRDALQLYGTARFAPLYPAERFGPDPSPAPPDPLDTTPTVDQEPPLVAASGGRSFSQEWGHRVARNGEQQFWINDAGWAEIHRGHDPTAAAKAISARGYLALNEPGRLRMKARIPGVPGPVRVYAVRGTILSDDQPDGSGADTPPSTKDQT